MFMVTTPHEAHLSLHLSGYGQPRPNSLQMFEILRDNSFHLIKEVSKAPPGLGRCFPQLSAVVAMGFCKFR